MSNDDLCHAPANASGETVPREDISLNLRDFIPYFEDRIIYEPNTGCWLWDGSVNRQGYARFFLRGQNGKTIQAHRYSYEIYREPIPEKMVIDHLCRVRSCVNPQHLEVVSNRENVLRGAFLKTHCPQGHPYSGDNLYLYKGKHRQCKTCLAVHRKNSDARKRRARSFLRKKDNG